MTSHLCSQLCLKTGVFLEHTQHSLVPGGFSPAPSASLCREILSSRQQTPCPTSYLCLVTFPAQVPFPWTPSADGPHPGLDLFGKASTTF